MLVKSSYIYIYIYIIPLNVYRRSHDSALLTVKERVINLKLNYSNFECIEFNTILFHRPPKR